MGLPSMWVFVSFPLKNESGECPLYVEYLTFSSWCGCVYPADMSIWHGRLYNHFCALRPLGRRGPKLLQAGVALPMTSVICVSMGMDAQVVGKLLPLYLVSVKVVSSSCMSCFKFCCVGCNIGQWNMRCSSFPTGVFRPGTVYGPHVSGSGVHSLQYHNS